MFHSLSSLSPQDRRKVETVRSVIKDDFDNAAAAFSKMPSADNWIKLEDCMWAHQYASNNRLEALITAYDDWGVGTWVEKFAALHRPPESQPEKE